MLVAPSILTADFSNLKQELKSINKADFIHLDIMDGHFVPNISFGPHISECISKETKIPLDTHLMVTDPLNWIDKFSIGKTKFITIHFEANNPEAAIKKIKANQIIPGISIKPDTKVSEIKHLLKDVGLVLVMSVEPGFGGQKFMPKALKKISELRMLREELKLNFIIEVDGGINEETAELCQIAGADMVVAGSYVFNSKNRNKTIKKLKEIKGK